MYEIIVSYEVQQRKLKVTFWGIFFTFDKLLYICHSVSFQMEVKV